MVYLILLGVLFFLQLLAASWYDLARKSSDSKKAFKHKMICSSTYIAGLFLCTSIGRHFTDSFGLLFLGGFLLLFVHDLLKEKKGKIAISISDSLGGLGFLLIAGALAIKNYEIFRPDSHATTIDEIIRLIFAIACLIISFTVKKHIAKLIPMAYLLSRAVIFGVFLQQSGDAKMQAASCAIIMGAVALAVSCVLSVFDKNDKKSLLRINLYYFGLMFISCSVAVL